MDAITFKSRVEQGKAIRRSVFQPVTSLVRQEDLAFCASRILMSVPLIQSQDPALAKWIEDSLGDMAAIQPEDALAKVKNAAGTYGTMPIYWATTCHILSQTLSEFSHEATAQTITELRQALPNWFPRFQDTLKAIKPPIDNINCLAIQTYYAQTAIFKDQEAYRWAQDRILECVLEDPLDSRHLQEMTALLGGSLDPREDEGQLVQLLEKLQEVSEYNESARLIREAIGGPTLSELSLSLPGKKKKKEKKATEGQSKLTSFLESMGETVGWALPIIGVVLVGGLCLWGVGFVMDWVDDTSPVGNQSLGQVYDSYGKNSEQKKAETENSEEIIIVDETIEIVEISPTSEQRSDVEFPEDSESIELTPESTPEEEIEIAAAVDNAPQPPSLESVSPDEEEISPNTTLPKAQKLVWFSQEGLPEELIVQINRDRQNMVPRLKMSRRNLAGHPTYARQAGMPLVQSNPQLTIVRYPITWFVSERSFPGQFIEAHYVRGDSGEWSVDKAARLTFPNGTSGGPDYVDSPQELNWAKSLFLSNPFYAEVSFQ